MELSELSAPPDWQLSELSAPPDFSVLKYPSPPDAMAGFMKKSNGASAFDAPAAKDGPLVTFTLKRSTYVFISVYLVSDSRTPVQGAYLPAADFHHDMRRLALAELQKEHRGVQVSDMGAINEWISQSTEGEEGESDDEEDDVPIAQLLGRGFAAGK
jgi:hypothetical protein